MYSLVIWRVRRIPEGPPLLPAPPPAGRIQAELRTRSSAPERAERIRLAAVTRSLARARANLSMATVIHFLDSWRVILLSAAPTTPFSVEPQARGDPLR